MPKILAIIGSPRKHGNTYKIVKLVEERLNQQGNIDFEYLYLKDLDLRPCLGCRACMDRGEEFCPLKDDLASIEQKILAADGVIIAAPTYVANVPGLLKNFIDRFAYVCHRPRFFKNVLMITTSGGGGAGFMLMGLSIALGTWGMEVAGKLSVVTHEHPSGSQAEQDARDRATAKKVEAAADRFYRTLGKPLNPGLMSLSKFRIARDAHLHDRPGSVDYEYWKGKGWYEKSAAYFYPVNAGPVKRAAAIAGSWVLGLLAK